MKIWLLVMAGYIMIRLVLERVVRHLKLAVENTIIGNGAIPSRCLDSSYSFSLKVLELIDVFGVSERNRHNFTPHA